MNIEQYRALKAKEEEEKDSTKEVEQPITPNTTVEETSKKEPEVDTSKDNETPEEETKPEVIEIDGEEVTLEELKNGYLRQSDYTKKTQEVAKTRKEYEEAVQLYESLKQNPQLVQQMKQGVSVPQRLDPAQAKVIELEEKLYDMILEREIETLQSKYDDFEIREVLELASQKEMTNLEDAYLLLKSTKGTTSPNKEVDLDKLKEDLRNEILEEIKTEANTKTVISPKSGGVPEVKEINISEAEKRVASNMGMTPQEYAKWRDV